MIVCMSTPFPLYSQTPKLLRNPLLRSLLRLPHLVRPPRVDMLYQPPLRQETAWEWHQRHPESSNYRLVAPSFRGRLKPCPLDHPEANQHPEWQMTDYEVPATFTIEIPYARVISKRGAVTTHDGTLLSDLSREFRRQGAPHSLIAEPPAEFQKPKRLRGLYALIASHGNCTYHWLFSTLTRIEVLRRAGYDLDQFDGFLARKPKFEAHTVLLEKAGVPLEKVRWCTTNSNIEAERLVIPSYPCNETRQNQPFVYPFLESLAGNQTISPRLRLYISREDSRLPHRRVVNEKELVALLQSYGFMKVTLTGLDVEEQVQLFASAEVIVAPHGGGLSNLVFTRPPAKVIEIFAPDYLKLSMRTICQDKGLTYIPFMGEHVFSSSEAILGQDIRVDIPRFETTLQNLLAQPSATHVAQESKTLFSALA